MFGIPLSINVFYERTKILCKFPPFSTLKMYCSYVHINTVSRDRRVRKREQADTLTPHPLWFRTKAKKCWWRFCAATWRKVFKFWQQSFLGPTFFVQNVERQNVEKYLYCRLYFTPMRQFPPTQVLGDSQVAFLMLFYVRLG
jgi:hypothetical protein